MSAARMLWLKLTAPRGACGLVPDVFMTDSRTGARYRAAGEGLAGIADVLEQWLQAQGVETGEAGADLEALRTMAAAAGWQVRPLYGREGWISAFEVEAQAASPATTQREAEALRRLLALLLAGVPFDDAVWDATDRGRDLDTARLLELYHQHRAARTADQGDKA